MKNLVVLTGAGISAESGVSTFRGNDGLWENHRIQDVATPEAWHKDPALVLEFYNQRRLQLSTVEPNEAHLSLTELEKFFDVKVITQNVDNLHERAGNSYVLHLHGELTKMRSTGPSEEVFELDTKNYSTKMGDKCPKGYQLRPHIVWFGEAVPEIECAIKLVQQADIFLIVGTSLQVYPAAGLINYLKQGTPIYVIDPNIVEVAKNDAIIIKKGAIEGMRDFISRYK